MDLKLSKKCRGCMIIIICSPSWVEDINMGFLCSQRLLLRFVNLFEVQMSHSYFTLINQ